MSRVLIGIGAVLILVGLFWPLIQRSGIGRLPGDIMIERDGFRFYMPLMTSIIASVVLSFLFWLWRKFTG